MAGRLGRTGVPWDAWLVSVSRRGSGGGPLRASWGAASWLVPFSRRGNGGGAVVDLTGLGGGTGDEPFVGMGEGRPGTAGAEGLRTGSAGLKFCCLFSAAILSLREWNWGSSASAMMPKGLLGGRGCEHMDERGMMRRPAVLGTPYELHAVCFPAGGDDGSCLRRNEATLPARIRKKRQDLR
jgi:hypothetical protein